MKGMSIISKKWIVVILAILLFSFARLNNVNDSFQTNKSVVIFLNHLTSLRTFSSKEFHQIYLGPDLPKIVPIEIDVGLNPHSLKTDGDVMLQTLIATLKGDFIGVVKISSINNDACLRRYPCRLLFGKGNYLLEGTTKKLRIYGSMTIFGGH